MTAQAATLLREHFDDIVDTGTHRTRSEILQYRAVPFEKLRPNVLAGFTSVLADLEHPPYRQYRKVFGEISYQRARQGFEVTNLNAVIDLTEDILENLIVRFLPEGNAQVSAVISCHRVCASARTAIMESFSRSNREYLDEANTLIAQLSSPLLPIYEGVIVLPLIGAMSSQRAQSILETALNGVKTYRARLLIVDITGSVQLTLDTAGYLVKAAQAVQLLGARVLLAGLTPEAAKLLSSMAIQPTGLLTAKDLQSGLEYALSERGLEIQPNRKKSP